MNRWMKRTHAAKVVLIRPPVNRWRLYRWYAPLCSREAPLGLLYIAGHLQNHGIEVSILDGERLGEEQTLDRIRQDCPELIGITSTTFSLDQASVLTKLIRAELPESLIVMGGSHVSVLPIDTMKHLTDLDGCVVGEGEQTMLEIASGTPAEDILGLTWRSCENAIYSNPSRATLNDLDQFEPCWDRLDGFPHYYQPGLQDRTHGNTISLVASRGCSYSCTFCAGPKVHGSKRRAHSPQQVATLMSQFSNRYSVRNFYFHDDNFTQDKVWLREFCASVLKEAKGVRWSCASRVEPLTPEILALMQKAGCSQIGIGVESASGRLLEWLGKGVDFDVMKQAIADIHAAGIETKLYLIIGTPVETIAELVITAHKVLQLRSAHIQVIYFTPLPGTTDALRIPIGKEFWPKMNLLNPIGVSLRRRLLLRLVELGIYGSFYAFKFARTLLGRKKQVVLGELPE